MARPRIRAGVFAATLIAVSFCPPSPAAETEQYHRLRHDDRGRLELRSLIMAPDSCYLAGFVQPGAPGGRAVAPGRLAITLVMTHPGAYGCVAVPKPVYFRTHLEPTETTTGVTVYLSNRRTGSVEHRELELPAL